jgi:hypothetical protein
VRRKSAAITDFRAPDPRCVRPKAQHLSESAAPVQNRSGISQ